MRRAALLALALAGLLASQALAEREERAELVPMRQFTEFIAPTTRYGHNVLGGNEYAGLRYVIGYPPHSLISQHEFFLPEDEVFEDIEPRFGDLTGDGRPEIVVVVSSRTGGAELRVYGLHQDDQRLTFEQIAATEPIGRPFRWLAPAGFGDFDGDGQRDIAYVDRPHLAKVLRIVTLDDDRLVEIASAPGFSNHRIGEDVISGGVRFCGRGTEVITADANWQRVLASRIEDGAIVSDDLGPYVGPESFERALVCGRR
ncbi:MAG: VCBS repeat-containing protein [Pseudomonadota bacterium]